MKVTKRIENGVMVINVDPGETVLCDLCNEDYTNSDEKGGFLFLSKAVCPKCAPDFLISIKAYREEDYIRNFAHDDESFRDFVYRIR